MVDNTVVNNTTTIAIQLQYNCNTHVPSPDQCFRTPYPTTPDFRAWDGSTVVVSRPDPLRGPNDVVGMHETGVFFFVRTIEESVSIDHTRNCIQT